MKKDEKDIFDINSAFFANQIEEKENADYLVLSEVLVNSINKYFKVDRNPSELEIFIEKKFNAIDDRRKLTCRNLAKLYTEETGNIIHKTYINNIIRNKLGLSYIKTSVEKSIINSQ